MIMHELAGTDMVSFVRISILWFVFVTPFLLIEHWIVLCLGACN